MVGGIAFRWGDREQLDGEDRDMFRIECFANDVKIGSVVWFHDEESPSCFYALTQVRRLGPRATLNEARFAVMQFGISDLEEIPTAGKA